jgi:hypothetical protein
MLQHTDDLRSIFIFFPRNQFGVGDKIVLVQREWDKGRCSLSESVMTKL